MLVCTLQHTGLGYVHTVCGISQINHTSSEDMHPEYPLCIGIRFYPSGTPKEKTHSRRIYYGCISSFIHIIIL